MKTLQDKIEAIALIARTSQSNIKGEEATKMALIVPFLTALNYDVSNPKEVIPEFSVDQAYHNSDKVDYAVISNSNIILIVECKSLNTPLHTHSKQLFHYYSATSSRFAILTNGIEYQFFCDIDKRNVMDCDYFFKFNIFNYTAQDLELLNAFSKELFCNESLYRRAEECKYRIAIQKWVNKEFDAPNKEFISYILRNVYNGNVTNNVIDKYTPIIREAISNYKIQQCEQQVLPVVPKEVLANELSFTKEEELVCAIIKSMLAEKISHERVVIKKTLSYCTIFLDKQIRKCVCRIVVQKKSILLYLPPLNKNITLLDTYEVGEYKEQILSSLQQL